MGGQNLEKAPGREACKHMGVSEGASLFQEQGQVQEAGAGDGVRRGSVGARVRRGLNASLQGHKASLGE